MTNAEQFVWWLKGYMDSGVELNAEQIMLHLNKVVAPPPAPTSILNGWISTTGQVENKPKVSPAWYSMDYVRTASPTVPNTSGIPNVHPTYPPQNPLVTYSTIAK